MGSAEDAVNLFLYQKYFPKYFSYPQFAEKNYCMCATACDNYRGRFSLAIIKEKKNERAMFSILTEGILFFRNMAKKKRKAAKKTKKRKTSKSRR